MKIKNWFTPEECALFNAHKEFLLANKRKLFGQVPDSDLAMITVQFPQGECLTYNDAKEKIKTLLHWIHFIAVVEQPSYITGPGYNDCFWSLHLHVLLLKKQIPKKHNKMGRIVESNIYDLERLCGYLSKQSQIWKQGPIVHIPKQIQNRFPNQTSLSFTDESVNFDWEAWDFEILKERIQSTIKSI